MSGILQQKASMVKPFKFVQRQGILTSTGNPFDLAINGGGLWVFDRNGYRVFGRPQQKGCPSQGSFCINTDGFIINAYGDRLMGFLASEDGTITDALGPLSIVGLYGTTNCTGKFVISTEGIISSEDINGKVHPIGQIALAEACDGQFKPIEKNAFVEVDKSVAVLIGVPGTDKFGLIQSGCLEDISLEEYYESSACLNAPAGKPVTPKFISSRFTTQTVVDGQELDLSLNFTAIGEGYSVSSGFFVLENNSRVYTIKDSDGNLSQLEVLEDEEPTLSKVLEMQAKGPVKSFKM